LIDLGEASLKILENLSKFPDDIDRNKNSFIQSKRLIHERFQ